jgi:hypothetical protein
MKPRSLFAFVIAGLGWSPEAAATHITCPNGAQSSAAEICPVFVQGDPSCIDAAQICSIVVGQQVVFSPPPNGNPSGSGITVTISGTTAVVKDTLTTVDQQKGRPGIDAIIARRNSAYIYCGTEILSDIVKAPGTQAPNQVTVCLAEGPCGLEPTNVINACGPYGGTANFLQAYKVGPVEQEVNICGCGDYKARFCDIRAPIFDGSGNPRFVSCNPDGEQILKSSEAESTATMGENSCVMRTIGGRRVLIDTETGLLC